MHLNSMLVGAADHNSSTLGFSMQGVAEHVAVSRILKIVKDRHDPLTESERDNKHFYDSWKYNTMSFLMGMGLLDTPASSGKPADPSNWMWIWRCLQLPEYQYDRLVELCMLQADG